ncbi:low-affinity Zn(2+) transporter zrt2 [Dipsacomyces acuminosporus]|nr:low-affinity Zn(2+) transporter zrt2 [Dipsacomyces acuminosporus]
MALGSTVSAHAQVHTSLHSVTPTPTPTPALTHPMCDVAGIGSHWDNDWHLAALFIIIGASALGVFLPILSHTSRSVGRFAIPMFLIQVGQFFGAGVIIATAFIHLFPAAHSALSNTCIGSFPDLYAAWASLFAMAAVFTIHSVEWWLVEAWVSRTAHSCSSLSGFGGRGRTGAIDEDEDDESFDNRLFPAYSRALNASRLILPPPALSPPIHPFVFGTSTISPSTVAARRVPSTFASRAGFATRAGFPLSKYANYAALVQSRQHLAMMQADQMSRYLYSDPQIPLFSPSMWPMPPSAANSGFGAVVMRGGVQAKSTPELMRRKTKSNRTSHTSSISAKRASLLNGISMRPNSFSSQTRNQLAKAKKASKSWKHRCLSMPRIQPTSLAEAVGEGLLEPLPPLPNIASPPPIQIAKDPSTASSSIARPESASSRGVSTKRNSRSIAGSRANRHSNCSTYESGPSRLDPVPETDDSWVTSMPYKSSAPSTVQTNAGNHMDRTEACVPPRISGGTTAECVPEKSRKRVSIPTPPPLPSSGLLPHTSLSMPRDTSCGQAKGGGEDASNNEEDSTAIHSKSSSLTEFTYPVEVKRRALATYILELGIALYSVLIGLALAISDRGFTAFLIAVCFHQFFEGLALGNSLAELYWIKAQIVAHGHGALYAEGFAAPPPPPPQAGQSQESDGVIVNIEDVPNGDTNLGYGGSQPVNVQVVRSTTFPTRTSNGIYQQHQQQQQQQQQQDWRKASGDDQGNTLNELHSLDRQNRNSKSRRTLTSLATSFTPEPWQVNPQLEKTLAGQLHSHVYDETSAVAQNGLLSASAAQADTQEDKSPAPPLGRYLQPRTEPERLPGWWKAWISALAFTFTTPTGIIIGLALRHVYEPNSRYALLLNGILQSICTGVLIYAGLVTLMVGGFNSFQFKQLSRPLQAMLFFAVYAGAAAMASLKIWK